uniref:Cephalosporinase (cepA) n=1 Tax=Bacteroides fragilis TaxID=817 RepID=Q45139_BACFG|nr:putative [Bacteroides fragilis]
MMTGTGSYRRILLQNLSYPFKRSERRIGNSISYRVIGTSPTTFTPHKIIFTVFLEHKRTFNIVLRSHFFIDSAIFKRNEPCKIIVQLYNIAMPPTTIIHIIMSIIIVYKLIDRLRSIHYFINQRLTQ